MAFSGENANLTWQRVKIALANASPAIQAQFAALKHTLAQDYRNPNLQFLAFSEVDADVAGGTVLLSGACRVVALYTKKEASATDNWTKLFDDATDDTTAGDDMLSLPQLEASVEACAIIPAGLPFATGIVVTQHTTHDGATDGSNGANGFVLITAA